MIASTNYLRPVCGFRTREERRHPAEVAGSSSGRPLRRRRSGVSSDKPATHLSPISVVRFGAVELCLPVRRIPILSLTAQSAVRLLDGCAGSTPSFQFVLLDRAAFHHKLHIL